MSKKDIVTTPETAEVEAVQTPVDETIDLAFVVMKEDGIHVEDLDGNLGDVCTKVSADCYLYLTPNAANRKVINYEKTMKFFAENPDSKIGLKFKATRTIGSTGPKLPNEKLISYLPEAEQEEYRAIIARAIAARDAEKNRPLTELEKAEKAYAAAQARIAKIQAELDALKNGATEA